jgi:hypothetical protein
LGEKGGGERGKGIVERGYGEGEGEGRGESRDGERRVERGEGRRERGEGEKGGEGLPLILSLFGFLIEPMTNRLPSKEDTLVWFSGFGLDLPVY